jgi:hypothetical protein
MPNPSAKRGDDGFGDAPDRRAVAPKPSRRARKLLILTSVADRL